LAGCACAPQREHTAAAEPSIRAAASLTPQHKRELALIGAAAMLSTAIALTPLVYREAPAILEASSIPITHVGLADPSDRSARYSAVPAERARWRRPASEATRLNARLRPAASVSGVTQAAGVGHAGFNLARASSTTAAGLVSGDGLIGEAPIRSGMVLTKSDRRQGGFSRLILGSGRHRVQPFPLPSGSN
jgi:hypothetical protein